jgi:heme exporter protein B
MTGALIAREVRRGLHGGAWMPVAFFLLVATIVPFAVGPDARLLARIGGGALWIAALTAALLPVERLVEPDRADGMLDQLSIAGISEEATGAAKMVGHWLTFGPLLLIAAIPGSFLVGLDGPALARSLISLAIGTPALAAMSVAVASLTAGLPRAGALAGLLMIPLAVPLVIFGATATGDGESAALKLEAAVALLLVAGAPFVTGAAIRASRT